MFSTEECAWAQTSVLLYGSKITGITGWSMDLEVDAEHLYAASDEAIDIQTGNKKVTGNLNVLKYEIDKMNDAAQKSGFASILDIPHEAIVLTCTFKKTATSKMRTISILGVKPTKLTFEMQQNAKSMPVPVPFLGMKMVIA